MIASVTPYEEMNPREIAVHWTRLDIKVPNGHSVFKSPNKALWAFVDERRSVTLVMWDVHTGHVVKEEKKEPSIEDLLTQFKDAPKFSELLASVKEAGN